MSYWKKSKINWLEFNRPILRNVGVVRKGLESEGINATVVMFSVISIEFLRVTIVILTFRSNPRKC